MYPAQQLGYPGWVLLVSALVGLVLFVSNARLLVYLSLFLLFTTDAPAYAYARLSVTGPFNLTDLLSLLCLAGALRVSRKGWSRMPVEGWAVVAVLAFGTLYTLATIGPVYEAMRAVRAALLVPIFFYTGYHAISDARQARTFVWIAALACFIQSLRQVAFVAAYSSEASAPEWRTLRYLNAGLPSVPLALLISGLASRLTTRAWLWIAVGLNGVAMFLTQTRSLWIPQAMACLWLTFESARRDSFIRAVWIPLLASAVFLGTQFLLGATGALTTSPSHVFVTGRSTDFSSGSGREEAMVLELGHYQQGNLLEWVTGLGLGYSGGPQFDPQVAWGHVGYVAYLSNLGLVGLFVFGVLLPWRGFVRGLALSRSGNPGLRAFGWLCCASLVSMTIGSFITGGLLTGYGCYIVMTATGAAASLAQESAAPARLPRASPAAVAGVRFTHGNPPATGGTRPT